MNSKVRTLAEMWDAGEVQFAEKADVLPRLHGISTRTEQQLSRHVWGTLSGPRREGRPMRGETASSTTVRSIRMEDTVWATVAAFAEESEISVNRWMVEAALARINQIWTEKLLSQFSGKGNNHMHELHMGDQCSLPGDYAKAG